VRAGTPEQVRILSPRLTSQGLHQSRPCTFRANGLPTLLRGHTKRLMSHPAIGLLRADMRELQDAWEIGTAAANAGAPLDPMHEALVYSSMVLLGVHGLGQLARLIEANSEAFV